MVQHVRASRMAGGLIATMILVAALGGGANAQDSTRTYAAALGSVSMVREAPDGTASVSADISLNASTARDAGARWIMVSIGNDDNAQLTVTPGDVTVTEGGDVSAERVESDGPGRANWFFNVASLPDTVSLRVTADVDTGGVGTDVEALVMAFGDGYSEVYTESGEMLVVQSWTRVGGGGGDSFQGSYPDTGNETGDNTTGGNVTGNDTTGNDTGDNVTGNDTTGNESEEEEAATPFPGIVLVAAGLVGAALLVRRRR